MGFETATQQYFEQNSSDDDVLEYPDLKTNVFREKSHSANSVTPKIQEIISTEGLPAKLAHQIGDDSIQKYQQLSSKSIDKSAEKEKVKEEEPEPKKDDGASKRKHKDKAKRKKRNRKHRDTVDRTTRMMMHRRRRAVTVISTSVAMNMNRCRRRNLDMRRK